MIMSRNTEQTSIDIDGLDIEAGLAETLPSATGRRLVIVFVCQLCFVILIIHYLTEHSPEFLHRSAHKGRGRGGSPHSPLYNYRSAASF
jgi:hypothetical protein